MIRLFHIMSDNSGKPQSFSTGFSISNRHFEWLPILVAGYYYAKEDLSHLSFSLCKGPFTWSDFTDLILRSKHFMQAFRWSDLKLQFLSVPFIFQEENRTNVEQSFVAIVLMVSMNISVLQSIIIVFMKPQYPYFVWVLYWIEVSKKL